MARYIQEHGQHGGGKVFKDTYDQYITADHVTKNKSVQTALAGEKVAGFVKGLYCCPEKHFGVCKRDDCCVAVICAQMAAKSILVDIGLPLQC